MMLSCQLCYWVIGKHTIYIVITGYIGTSYLSININIKLSNNGEHGLLRWT